MSEEKNKFTEIEIYNDKIDSFESDLQDLFKKHNVRLVEMDSYILDEFAGVTYYFEIGVELYARKELLEFYMDLMPKKT